MKKSTTSSPPKSTTIHQCSPPSTSSPQCPYVVNVIKAVKPLLSIRLQQIIISHHSNKAIKVLPVIVWVVETKVELIQISLQILG